MQPEFHNFYKKYFDAYKSKSLEPLDTMEFRVFIDNYHFDLFSQGSQQCVFSFWNAIVSTLHESMYNVFKFKVNYII